MPIGISGFVVFLLKYFQRMSPRTMTRLLNMGNQHLTAAVGMTLQRMNLPQPNLLETKRKKG